MPAFFSDSPEFQKLLAGEERPSLVPIALEIARDAYPDLNLDHYLGKIDQLAERVGTRCGPGAKPRKLLSALPIQRRLARVAGDDPAEQRDLGMICLHSDRPGEAIDPLQRYLDAQADAEDAENVTNLLNAARRLVAQWN